MAKHLLTYAAVDKAKPGVYPDRSKKHLDGSPYRLADGEGLFLWVPLSGVKAWQFRYRYDGKPQTATLGRFNTVQGLDWARKEADKARSLVEQGEHLTKKKAVSKATKRAATANTFSAVAKDWLADERREAGWSDDYYEEVAASLRNHLDKLDDLPVSEITAAMASPLLRRLKRVSPDMGTKVHQRLRAILDYAVEGGLIQGNPVIAPKRRKKKNNTKRNLPAVTDKPGVGAILRAAEQAEISHGVRRAHLLCVFTAQRISEIVGATWSEIDLQAGVWTIPRARMKRKDEERGDHQVPIPPRLLAEMREWHRTDGKDAEHVCGAPHTESTITREAVEKFYRRTLGLTGKHSPHSWRTVLSTWANDAGKDEDVVEAQLDHITGSKVKAAYDRAKRLERRAELMRWHERALIAARDGADVVDLSKRRSAKH